MKNPWKLSSFVLAGLLAASVSSTAIADRQPNMRDALRALYSAKSSLERASHDKGGHRVKALELVNGAIGEVQLGIKVDNRN